MRANIWCKACSRSMRLTSIHRYHRSKTYQQRLRKSCVSCGRGCPQLHYLIDCVNWKHHRCAIEMEPYMERERLMVFGSRDCEGCRNMAEIRRVAQDRAAEIRRLQHEID